MKKVLVIDDDKNFCNLVRIGLEARDSFHVVIAHDGQQGIKMAVEEKPDIILLDVVMPEIDGMKVAELLKEDPRIENIPVVFVTAMITEDDVRKKTHSQGVYFLAKPIQINSLAEMINSIVA